MDLECKASQNSLCLHQQREVQSDKGKATSWLHRTFWEGFLRKRLEKEGFSDENDDWGDNGLSKGNLFNQCRIKKN